MQGYVVGKSEAIGGGVVGGGEEEGGVEGAADAVGCIRAALTTPLGGGDSPTLMLERTVSWDHNKIGGSAIDTAVGGDEASPRRRAETVKHGGAARAIVATDEVGLGGAALLTARLLDEGGEGKGMNSGAIAEAGGKLEWAARCVSKYTSVCGEAG